MRTEYGPDDNPLADYTPRVVREAEEEQPEWEPSDDDAPPAEETPDAPPAEETAKQRQERERKEREARKAAQERQALIRNDCLTELTAVAEIIARRVMPTGPTTYVIADAATGVWEELSSAELMQRAIVELRPAEERCREQDVYLTPRERRDVVQDALDRCSLPAGSLRLGDHPHLLGLPGGQVVDLRTGQQRPSTPDDHLASWHVAGVTPAAGEPTAWLDLLRQLVPDTDTRRYVCEALGASIWGQAMQGSRAHILMGPAGCGKTMVLGAVADALGPMCQRDPEGRGTLGVTDSAHQAKLHYLATRATVVIADELEAGRDVEISTIKARLDGTPMLLSRKGGAEQEVNPRWSVWGTANDHLRGALDAGVTRRIITVQVPANDHPTDWWEVKARELREQLPQLLGWLIGWAVRGGGKLPVLPDSLTAVQQQVALDADPIAAYIAVHTTASTDTTTGVRTQVLVDSLRELAGIKTTAKALTSRLQQAGYQRRPLGGYSLWHISLSAEAQQAASRAQTRDLF